MRSKENKKHKTFLETRTILREISAGEDSNTS